MASLFYVQSFNLQRYSNVKTQSKLGSIHMTTKVETTTDKITDFYGKVRNFDANVMITSYEEKMFNLSLIARAKELFGADETDLDEIFRTPELRQRLIRSYSNDTAGIGATFIGVFLGYFWAHGGFLTMTLCGLAGNSLSSRSDSLGTIGRIAGGLVHTTFRDLPRGNIPLLKDILDSSGKKEEVSSSLPVVSDTPVTLDKVKSTLLNMFTSARDSADSR